ncbi:MAG TPA: TonB-dependent receptor plug domain-containing protein [Mucilaginibacter sp.]|nr:TonB-dependent receptor plug domain-containing protein [Mucilaginibacter sp.]
MKQFLIVVACLFMFCRATAQNTLKALVRSDQTKEALKGATVTIPDLHLSAITDSAGNAIIENIPNGMHIVNISYVGFSKQERGITFPVVPAGQAVIFDLEPQEGELAGITIETTRTNQSLKDIPTRVEVLPAEELEEKNTERPADVKMLLAETTGILLQNTSAVSGSASFRIQGLDSRYTQLLQDGMPMYAGFSGSLSLLQVSPLDLKQVEFIKGSASTLYGGGAIAGLVNLISRTPQAKPELTVLLNGTSSKGFDGSAYYSQKWKHIGTTIFSSYNYNGAYDPSGQGFSAVPLTHRFTLNPKVFLYADDHNSGWFGVNITNENRLGGDMQVIGGHADSLHQYFERNKTFRFSTQMVFTHKIDSARQFNFKNTVGYFDRNLGEPGSLFRGTQVSSFTELNYVQNGKSASWVTGLNFITDKFDALPPESDLSYHQATIGAFLQNTWKANNWFSVESGLRADKNTPPPSQPANGLFILPRVNALFKISRHFSSRIGGGLGYKMPNLFNDEAEEDGYQNIQPLNIGNTKAEQSYGLNADVNYKIGIGDAFFTANQLFFYTRVDHALILQNNAFVNTPGFVSSRGAETNISLAMDELTFYLGYTYTDARLHDNGTVAAQPLTPKHRFSFDSAYELEDNYRIGIESFYTSSQLLSNGTTGRGFITFGALAEKMWKHFDIFINSEDLTDRRQTRWAPLYTGSITHPNFADVYTPLDGVVVNVGVRLKLLN